MAAPADKRCLQVSPRPLDVPLETAIPDEPRPENSFRRRQSLREQLGEVWRFREFGITLAEPLLLMLAFTLIFTKFASVNSHGVPYPVYSYVALIPGPSSAPRSTPGRTV